MIIVDKCIAKRIAIFCFCFPANSEPPVNSQCTNASDTSLFVSWEEYTHSNSENITFYITWQKIGVSEIFGSFSDLTLQNYKAQTRSLILSNLEIFTNYSVTVNTYNEFGLGISSDVIYCFTDEGCKYLYPCTNSLEYKQVNVTLLFQ